MGHSEAEARCHAAMPLHYRVVGRLHVGPIHELGEQNELEGNGFDPFDGPRVSNDGASVRLSAEVPQDIVRGGQCAARTEVFGYASFDRKSDTDGYLRRQKGGSLST
ncbi:hypothetical protein RE9431_12970 [Prescottella equi]|nr:hypothetical protein RE9431_12970 [Prescottella equi]